MREYGSRIIVIGCPGAGKSTFARKLRDKTGLPLYYLDMLYHKPDRLRSRAGNLTNSSRLFCVPMNGSLTGTIRGPCRCVLRPVRMFSFWICLRRSVCGAPSPESVRRAKTCRGSNRNSIPGFGSISWIFGRIRSRGSMNWCAGTGIPDGSPSSAPGRKRTGG